jgi:uncharacterized protein YeaO (DUF488 family)
MIKIKRIYEESKRGDGKRVLVDRLWPRGVSKERADLDLWMKEIAPTTELRKWFGHDPKKWPEFKKRYKQELRKNKASVEEIKKLVGGKTATFLYGAKDEEHNEAVVLKDFLS